MTENHTHKLFISCKDATLLSEIHREKKLGLGKKIRFFLHLLTCHSCRKFIRQTKKMAGQIHSVIRGMEKEPLQRLDADFKQQLEQQIQNKLKN